MRGFYVIECDIDGQGKRWRLARVDECAGSVGSYFMATFVDDIDFEEELDVYVGNGSRMVGPLTVQNLLSCVCAGEYLLDAELWFLPQRTPGEARILAAKANGIQSASRCIADTGVEWKRINFDGLRNRFEKDHAHAK